MQYRIADSSDIELLSQQRAEFSYRMKGLTSDPSDDGYSSLLEKSREYFSSALPFGECDAVLVYDGERLIASGTIFYYRSVPSVFNPEGKNGYITSIFVEPEHRRQGIASRIVTMLTDRARERGVVAVMLTASDEGRELYSKLGFSDTHNAMFLDTRL